MPSIEFIEFTDPICTWCWGSEPQLRALKYHYGDDIAISFVMGGLVDDIRRFWDERNGIGGDPEQSNAMIAKHWLEASAVHGMPTSESGMHLFSKDRVSSYPQNIAFEAANIASPEAAPRFLRRVREATYIDNKITSDPNVLIEIANETGVDLAGYLEALQSGAAERAFRGPAREMCDRYQVGGFPAFLVRVNGNEVLLRGYQRIRPLYSLIDHLTGGKIKAPVPDATPEAVLDFVQFFGEVFPVEIKTAFLLNNERTDALIQTLEAAGNVRVEPAANGRQIMARNQTACQGGVCKPA